jgi:hypothetical protein
MRLLVIPFVVLLATVLAACRSSDSPASRADSLPVQQLPVLDSSAAKLVFQDQANESFRRFRTDLLGALARRDTAFLMSTLAPEIRNNFGDNGGIREFERQWRTGNPDSPLWGVLIRVLELGGRLEHDTLFSAPYVYAFWPDSVDAFSHVAVIDSAALVRSDRSDRAAAIGTVNRAILEVAEPVDDTSWAQVILPGGKRGWMDRSDVYSPVGWRAIFANRQGRWWLTALVAGD